MGYSLEIPKYKPFDASGIEEVPQLFQAARKTQADIAYKKAETANQDRKLSADMARQQWEDQQKAAATKHGLDIETASQFLPGSPLMRAGANSAAIGTEAGKPYGISFEQTTEKPAALPDANTPSDAEAAKFLMSGGQHVAPGEQDPLLDFKPPVGEPETGDQTTPPAAPPVAPPLDANAALATREAALPETRHTYAKVAGQRFEVPGETKSSYFEEPKYNAMFDKLVAEGIADKDAFSKVEAVRHADIGEMGKNTREDKFLGFKDTHTETAAQKMQHEKDALAQSGTNAETSATARVEAAKILAGGGSMGDPKKLNAYNSFSKDAFARSGAKIDQAGMRLHDRIAAELDAGNLNPYSQQMALHTLSAMSVSTGTSAGRVLKSAIDDIKNAPGMIDSSVNQLYRAVHGGQNMPEINDKLRGAAEVLRKVGHAQAEHDYQTWSAQAGRTSKWYQDPDTHGLVDDADAAVRSSLGLDPINFDETNAPPSTPAAPAPAPGRHHTPKGAPAKAAPQGTPAPHPSGDPVGTVKPDPKTGKPMRKVGPNNWQPVQQ